MTQQPFIQIGRYMEHHGGAIFGMRPSDARNHCYIIGKTGSGKTTLLRNLLLQHLALGHGFALIDPHGDLAEEILQHVPRWRTDHVVYFNPGDRDFPIAFNPLANVPHDQQSLAVSGIVSALKNLWPDSWGPRMEFILQNAVAALLEADNTSLLGVNRMLTDKVYRDHIVRQVSDPFVRDYWTREFESYDPRFRREAIAPIQNKLGQFEIIARLHRNGQLQVPFRGVTLPPIVGESGLSERAIAKSRDRFATLRGIVEDKLSRWIG